MFRYELIENRSEAVFRHNRFTIGPVKLWLPEAIGTDKGSACVYPFGMSWVEQDGFIMQEAEPEHCFGPGNSNEVEPGIMECCGIRFPKEPVLVWRSKIRAEHNRIEFSLCVRNTNSRTMENVCAKTCIKFMNAQWWDDDNCFVITRDGIKSIAELGRSAGLENHFQAWLLEGEACNHPFASAFWGFNPVRVLKPVWAVRNKEAGCSIVLSCESGLYIHSNSGNPCNDLALKYGDMEPDTEQTVHGAIEISEKSIEEIFS